MKIKSLLLGSAAAMLAVSGASAADAIVAAEPEPVEYVRVCDAFGAGYFYIPGTETCLKISGFVRMNVTYSNNDVGEQTSSASSWGTSVRGRVNFQAKEDTEYGVLHAYVRLQGDNSGGGDGAVVVDQGYAELGGLVFGYTESVWVSSKNGGASGFGSHSDNGLNYGYGQANQIGYNFTGANWFAAISAQDDGDASSAMPDIAGRIGGVFAGATIYAAAGYDQSAENFGVKLGLNTDIGPAGNLIVQGFYADGPTIFGANTTLPLTAATKGTRTAEWSVLASYQHQFTPNFKGSVGGQYSADYYATALNSILNAAPGTVTTTQTALGSASSGIDSWAVEGVLVWNPVANLEVRGEVRYTTFSGLAAGLPAGSYFGVDDQVDTLFRLQRNF
ncbi:porin [Nitratireductor sp. XY-223]|uniref:porin n=1 Tax=Nitratireductor sp. XY-223 TaxID=2561926 RepID=UPI0010A9D54D|nr:porin [Nitratireductor sp. XY-223]